MKLIGSGLFRKVYEYDKNTVLKVNKTFDDLTDNQKRKWLNMARDYRGYDPNKVEWENWLKIKKIGKEKFFAPCIKLNEQGLFMRKVEIPAWGEKKYQEMLVPIFYVDPFYANYGILDGRIVCLDYQHMPRFNLTKMVTMSEKKLEMRKVKDMNWRCKRAEKIERAIAKDPYQDIEAINFIGTTKSYRLWDYIKDLVDWKGKTVVDFGSHHGYFAIKAVKAGAKKVIAIEKVEKRFSTLCTIKKKTFRDLAERKKIVVVRKGLPEGDIFLCLNALHYVKDKEEFLRNVKCDFGIFRVVQRLGQDITSVGNKGDILNEAEIVKKYFDVREIPDDKLSGSKDRRILYGKKRPN